MKLKLFITISLISVSVFSQTRKIEQLEKQRKAALREIENTNKLLQDTKKTTATLLSRIKLITSQIDNRKSVVSILNQEINGISVEEKRTQQEIVELEKTLKEKQQRYAKAVRSMAYKKQSENRLLFVLSGKSIGESIRRMRYLKDYSEWRTHEADDIKLKRDDLTKKKASLENSRLAKLSLLALKESEQKKLVVEEEAQKGEISEASKKEKELQKTLTDKRTQANALNRQIEKLIAEEIARQEREAKRLADEKAKKEREAQERAAARAPKTQQPTKTERPQEQQQKPKEQQKEIASVSTPQTQENFNLSNSFVSNKGKLPMPVTGSYSIVSRFGTHQYSQWITTNSNGIDIQAQPNADARSVFGGEVSRIIAFPGYNNCIIIRHGNYYTFYGNIQNVYVKQGDKVTTGQSIGKIYTDSETGHSQLHFQLWRGTAKQNPEPWLKR